MKKYGKDESFNNVNLNYNITESELDNDIIGMLKNLYNNKTDLEILIKQKASKNEIIYLRNKINLILNGKNQSLKNFSVDVFNSNKISIIGFKNSEIDIFSSSNNFLMIFLRKGGSDFIICKIIRGKDEYPVIIKTSFFNNLLI